MANPDFRLDDWVVRRQRCCIERGAESRRVKPKAMQVLERLAEARGNVVSRQELFDAIWPGHAVSDDVLTNCVVELRKAFDDSPKEPRVIETIPKKGFRIVSKVLPVDESVPAETPTWHFAAVTVLLLMAVGAAWYGVQRVAPSASSQPAGTTAIAVLPFVDMSPLGDQEYFADGLSEELINRLTQLQGLQVTGRTSSFYFKGRNQDLREIGERLSVSHVLEGSVRKSDDALRITAQLVDVGSGFHLWSDTYDRGFEDIFAIQDEIAEAVARALSIRLSVGRLGTLEGGTANVAAYDAIMQGNSILREFSADSTLRAISYFRRAVDLDPDFAIAWERLANTYRLAWLTFGDNEAERWGALADEAITKARANAPTSLDVLETAAAMAVDRRDLYKARRLFDEVQALGPRERFEDSGAYLDLMTKTGDIDEALRLNALRQRQDPLHPYTAMYGGHLLVAKDRSDEALVELERGYALDGYRSQISVEGMVAALASGQSDEILKWLGRAVENQQPGSRGVHDAMLERFGDPERALDWLITAFESRSIGDYYVIVWASYYGDDELALRAMQRSPDLWVFWTPLTQRLRATAEFRELVESIGLVDYWRRFGWNDYCRPSGELEFECS